MTDDTLRDELAEALKAHPTHIPLTGRPHCMKCGYLDDAYAHFADLTAPVVLRYADAQVTAERAKLDEIRAYVDRPSVDAIRKRDLRRILDRGQP